MRFSSFLVLVGLIMAGFWACFDAFDSKSPSDSDALFSFLKESGPLDSVYTFLAEEGFSYQLDSGTEIYIPKSSLLGHGGHIVNGEVSLHFREFRDAIDLLAGQGILDGQQEMMKTAGAFNIEIHQRGKRLFFDPSQNIEIKQACYEKEDDYSLFVLDKTRNKWDSLFMIKALGK